MNAPEEFDWDAWVRPHLNPSFGQGEVRLRERRPVDDVAYDGPEPTEGYVSDREADLRADIEYGERQRQSDRFVA